MTEYSILQDTRTHKYFGGGKADQLFVYWVEDLKQAKKFYRQELMIPTLQQLAARTLGHQETMENQLILDSIPLFEPHAFMIYRFPVDDAGQLSSPTIETIFPLLERNLQSDNGN